MTVRLILDHTALSAFGWGAHGVGETIAEILDEDARVAAPVTAVAEALAQLTDEQAAVLRLLLRAPSFEVLDVTADDEPLLAAWTRRLLHVGRAACVVEALARRGCYVLTADPGGYGRDLNDANLIVGLDG